MKNLLTISMTLLCLMYFSCQNNFEQPLILETEHQNPPSPKAFVSPNLGRYSTSNPTLYDNWESLQSVLLNNGLNAYVPWYYAAGNSMNIPSNIRMDIKKEDGWEMLGHTLEYVPLAEPDYILFYNKRTGILKGFYHSPVPQQNQTLKWVLKATQPSTLITTNDRISNLSNIGKEYTITSNLNTPSVVSADAALHQGWNCFTFEIPYGTINQKPIISISGYTVNRFELQAQGTLSGQVVVPTMVNSNDLQGWKDFMSISSSFSGATNTFAQLFNKKPKSSLPDLTTEQNPVVNPTSIIGTIATINSAVSIASSLLGGASFFTSKKEMVIQRYDFSGNIELTGSVVGQFDGAVYSINNIDLNQLKSEALGVWGVKELPSIKIDKYGFVRSVSVPVQDHNSYEVTRWLNVKPQLRKEAIIINPAVLPLVKDYKVIIGDVISTNSNDKKIPLLTYEQIQDDWFSYGTRNGLINLKTSINPWAYMPLPYTRNFDFYIEFMNSFPEMFVSVLVEIEYLDGSYLSSSRVFKVNGSVYDNRNDIMKKTPSDTQVMFVNYWSAD